MQYVLYYFIAVSVIGAIVCIYDKLAAVRGWRRVSERTLFFWALIGGGPACTPPCSSSVTRRCTIFSCSAYRQL